MTRRTICSIATCDLLNNSLALQLQEAPNKIHVRAKNPDAIIALAVNLRSNGLDNLNESSKTFVEDVLDRANHIDKIKDLKKLSWETERLPQIKAVQEQIGKILTNADFDELAQLAKDLMGRKFLWTLKSWESVEEIIVNRDANSDDRAIDERTTTNTTAQLTTTL